MDKEGNKTNRKIQLQKSPSTRPLSARSNKNTKRKPAESFSPKPESSSSKSRINSNKGPYTNQRNASQLLLREKTCCASAYNRSTIVSNIPDKEDLFHELTLAKQAANDLKEENVRLKTKVQLAELDAKKKHDQLKELLEKGEEIGGISAKSYGSITIKGKTETKLELELKEQVKKIKEEKVKIEIEYSNLKKSIRSTRFQELNNEIKTYIDECQRLRKLCEEYENKRPELTPEDIQAIEEKIIQQSNIIKNLQKENETANLLLSQKDTEIAELRSKNELLQSKNAKLSANSKLFFKQKKQLAENAKTIQTLKNQLSLLKPDITGNEFASYKSRINELLKSQSELKEKLEQREKRIKLLESKKIAATKQNSLLSMSESECRELKGKIVDYEHQIEALSQRTGITNTMPLKKTIVKAVELEEIKDIVAEIRLNLRLLKIEKSEIKEKIFGNLIGLDDPISIYELLKIFKRRPLNLQKADEVLLLARYLIEPMELMEIEFNELAENTVKTVLEKLENVLGEYKIWNEEMLLNIKNQIEQKIEQNIDRLTPDITKLLEKPFISYSELENALMNINELQFSYEEIDFLTIKAYEESRNMNSLKVEFIADLIEGVAQKLAPKDQEINENQVIVHEEHKNEAKEEKNDKSKTDTEFQTIDEEQMILIAQKCFYEIAQKLISKKLTIQDLYKGKIFTKQIEDEKVELLTQTDFINGIQELDIEDMQPLQYACLIQVLAINDEDKHVRVTDLIQILVDYGVEHKEESKQNIPEISPEPEKPTEIIPQKPEEKPEEKEEIEDSKEELSLNFDKLDKVSMVLMLALTEYMIKTKVSVQDLFGKSITFKDIGKGRKVEVLESIEFFKLLAKIGINIEEKEHQNLKTFLCYDNKDLEKFSTEKLMAAIEEFGTNEELREFAHKCYEELVNEDFTDEEKNEGDNKNEGKELFREFEDANENSDNKNDGNNTL